MRKILTFMLACAAVTASAEGYQVNSLSARQMGMGHTGTAQKLDAESMVFNPAGMAFMDRTIDFHGSVTGIFAYASATTPDGVRYQTANDPSTPMSFNLGMNVYRNLKAGLSFYTPYGSGINWGENWPGAVFSQSVSLKTFTLQPTLAWRILPNLSIGAGAMVTWGSVNLDKGLVDGATFSAITDGLWAAGDTPASVNLKGKAKVKVGVNVGLMWDVSSRVTIGASFRQQMNMTVQKGRATVNYANEMAEQLLQSRLNLIDQANFTATMPCAAVWNLGVTYKPTPRWTISFDAQLTHWKAYRNLKVDFLSEILTPYDQDIPKNYHDAMLYKLGAQYALTNRFDLRLGLMVDTTPVKKENYNPETPGMTRVSPTLGFTFRPIRNFGIDFALMYTAGCGRDGASVTSKNMLTDQPLTFTADYRLHAWNPAIGLSYAF